MQGLAAGGSGEAPGQVEVAASERFRLVSPGRLFHCDRVTDIMVNTGFDDFRRPVPGIGAQHDPNPSRRPDGHARTFHDEPIRTTDRAR